MPAPLNFTPTFLTTPFIKNTAESSQASSREEGRVEGEPLYYSPAKHGAIDNFVRSAEFAKFKEEYRAIFTRITAFVETHGDLLVPSHLVGTPKEKYKIKKEQVDKVKQYFAVLQQHLFEGNFFNPPQGEDHRGDMYATCKQWFHHLAKLLQNSKIRPETRMAAVMDLAPRLDACSGGIMADLQGTVAVLRAASEGIAGLAYKRKKNMLDALILNYVKANHVYPAGEEIHYVQAYYNALAPEMGMEQTRDPYADNLLVFNPDFGDVAITPVQVAACIEQVRETLQQKPTWLAADIAEEYRSRIEEALRKENLDPNNIDAATEYHKVKTILNELASEYGKVSEYDVLEPSDDYTAVTYIGAQQPVRGTRHFLRLLKDQGLVDYEQRQINAQGEKVGGKSTIELGETSAGRIKLLEGLLWLKEGKGQDGSIREFSAPLLLTLNPGELLDKIEQGRAHAQQRASLLHDLLRRLHESLEAEGTAGERLGPWLKGFTTNMKEIAARHPGEAGPSWAPGWSDPVILLAAAFDQGEALGELLEAGGDKNAKDENGRTALMLAAQGERLQAAQALLEQGADIGVKDHNGDSALMVAARNGSIGVLEALLAKDLPQEDKDTSLLAAADRGHGAVLKALIRQGANIDAKNEYGDTALMRAAMEGHVEAVKALIEAEANINEGDDNQWTALIWAACNGHVEAVKALIEAGANINEESNEKWTALICAAENGHVEVVKALMGKEANIDAKNKDGATALMRAAEKGHVEAVEALIEAGANINEESNEKWTALICAAENGHVEVVKALMGKEANIDAKNMYGATALMRAAMKGHVEAVKALIEAGANINEEGNDKWTALMFSAGNGYVEIAKALIGKRVNIDAKNKYGDTALMLAATQGQVEAVKALIEAGANINEEIDDKGTALIFAAENGHVEVVNALIGKEAIIDAKNMYGATALMRAATQGQVEAVKVLIEAGANINEEGNDKRTALINGAENGHVEVLKTLFEKYVNVEAKDQDGYNALMHAAKNGHVEAVTVLLQEYGTGVRDLMDVARSWVGRGRKAKEIFPKVLLRLAQDGSTSVLARLIKAGGNRFKDAQGKTALMHAIEWMQSDSARGMEALQALLDAGADIGSKDNDGKTAKDYAGALAIRDPNPNDAALRVLNEAEAQRKKARPWNL